MQLEALEGGWFLSVDEATAVKGPEEIKRLGWLIEQTSSVGGKWDSTDGESF